MNTQDLLNTLLKVKPGINIAGSSTSMGYFYFTGKNVITYNNTISVRHPFLTDFTGFIRSNELLNLLTKIKTPKIKMGLKDNKVFIQTNRINASLNTIEDDDFVTNIKTIEKYIKKAKWKQLPKTFCDCIKTSASIYIKEETDNIFTTVSINGNTCISTDNQRVVKTVMNDEMDDMLIQGSEIEKMVSIGPIKYASDKKWLHFKNKYNCILSIRKISGTFPDLTKMFKFKGKKIDLPKKLTDGIDITTVFVDSFSPYINIKIESGKCILSIESNYGKVEHKSKIKYSGATVEFGINPEFLKNMMKYSATVIINKDNTRLRIGTNNYSLISALYGQDE